MTDLSKELDGLEQAAVDALRGAEHTGDGVQLPFEAAYFWWMNGKSNAKNAGKECPALYFGGWASDSLKLGELVESGAITEYPSGFTAFKGAGDRGEWDGQAARALTVSTIASRQRWVSQDGKTSGPEFDRAKGLVRRHLQMLCLAYSAGKPLGYAVLTAKGYQVQHLQAAVADWQKAIRPFLKELNASQFPLSAFALTVGTAGEAANFVSVGGSGAQSKITPIKAIIPADLSAEKVSKRFIGAQNLRANAERLRLAAEWLAAWKTAGRSADPAGSEGADEPAAEQPDW